MQVTVELRATPPRFHKLRLAAAVLLVRWAAALIASVINGVRIEVVE